MTALRWEKQKEGGWLAYSGILVVGMVVLVQAGPRKGKWTWVLDRVRVHYGRKNAGDVSTAASGRRAVDRAWTEWCEMAGLRRVE